ncbi:MAG: glycosyltransferase family 39 protein, partial [Terracidiphilus sp.]
FFGLVYGSYAPTSANPFIDNAQLQHLWRTPARYYLFAKATQLNDLASIIGRDQLITVCTSGGKVLLTNHPIANAGGS